MEKITNIELDQNNKTLSFTLKLTNRLDENRISILMDEYYNVNNLYSDNTIDHSYNFNIDNSDIHVYDLGNFKYDVIIEREMIGKLDDNIKYIKVVNDEDDFAEGIYYNPEVIFNAELQYIKNTCNTCVDDKQMQLLVHVIFKKQLLESALETGDYVKGINLYINLCRLLEVSLCDGTHCELVDSCYCESCANGVCALKR